MGKRDRERFHRTGLVRRGVKLIPQEEVVKKSPEPTTPIETFAEAMEVVGVPRISISDRLTKMKKKLEE